MSANLLLKLSEKLHIVHSTYYISLPHQLHQEPIDYLLQTFSAPKKWKINTNYEPNENSSDKQNKFLFDSISVDMSPNSKITEPHLNRMIRESAQKIYCLKLPIKFGQNLSQVPQTSAQPDLIRHSYSIGFMIRFDDNLINFSKSFGLTNNQKNNTSFETYAHLFSVNLDNESSSFEIWLNPSGNLLFM